MLQNFPIMHALIPIMLSDFPKILLKVGIFSIANNENKAKEATGRLSESSQ